MFGLKRKLKHRSFFGQTNSTTTDYVLKRQYSSNTRTVKHVYSI